MNRMLFYRGRWAMSATKGVLLVLAFLSLDSCRSSDTTSSETLLGNNANALKASYTNGLAQGRMEADQQAKAGNLSIYTFGFVSSPGVDPETHLPTDQVGGCPMTAFDLGRVMGHNERIRQIVASATKKGYLESLIGKF